MRPGEVHTLTPSCRRPPGGGEQVWGVRNRLRGNLFQVKRHSIFIYEVFNFRGICRQVESCVFPFNSLSPPRGNRKGLCTKIIQSLVFSSQLVL